MSAKESKKSSTGSLHQKLDIADSDGEAEVETEMLEHPSYEEMQTKLTKAEELAAKYQDQFLRSQADMENIQRRVERDVANAHNYALGKFVLELLPVVDSLERALSSHLNDPAGAGSLFDGVSLTLKMFQTTLEKFGVEAINPLNEPFNPELHQAVSTQEEPGTTTGTVLNVLQKGYLLNKRLIRPALVIVAK